MSHLAIPSSVQAVAFKYTESYVAESLVSKRFNQAAHDESLHQYLFYQFCSILEVEAVAFDRSIQADPQDSYFVKVGKSIKYLNHLRDRTKVGLCGFSESGTRNIAKDRFASLSGLSRLVLPKSKDIYSCSLLTLCKNAYREAVDANFILFGERLCNFSSKLLLKQFENLLDHEKTDQFRTFFSELNPDYYDSIYLKLDNLGFSLLPNEIGNCKKVVSLSLSNNQLVNLPKSIENLNSLEYLNLSGNEFINFPECIFQLKNLKTLDLTQNPLKVTPELLTNLKEALPNLEFKYDSQIQV